ncbi:MAG: DUF6383 domain-containing protein, partial [Tannerella sp.]|nr:DUF6383 domain-containing protein [Tannerella sp.]
ITWNNTTKKLDIAKGLPEGEYKVVIRAANSFGSHTLTFVLTVSDVVYWMETGPYVGGKVTTAPPYIGKAGQLITLVITPDAGYELESITVVNLNNQSVVIPLSGTGNTRTFTMPAHHVCVLAVFKSNGTAVEEVRNGLKAFAQNGVLQVSGLSVGRTWSVYNVLGTLIYQGIANNDQAEITLPGRGVYIVTNGNKVIKVSN